MHRHPHYTHMPLIRRRALVVRLITCFVLSVLFTSVLPTTAHARSDEMSRVEQTRSAQTRSAQTRSAQSEPEKATPARQDAQPAPSPTPQKRGGVGGFLRRMHERAQTQIAEDERRAQQGEEQGASRHGGLIAAAGTRPGEVAAAAGECATKGDRFAEHRTITKPLGAIHLFREPDADSRRLAELRLAFEIELRDGEDPNRPDTRTPQQKANESSLNSGRHGEVRRGTSPPRVVWWLRYVGTRPVLLGDVELRAITDDGRPFALGRVTRFGHADFRGETSESYRVSSSIEDFRRLTAAQRVEVQIRNLEFTFSAETLEGMREFARCAGIRIE